MKKILNRVISSVLFIVVLVQIGSADIKQVRIAHYIASDISTIPDGFMQYARSCGYNYLLAMGGEIGLSSGTPDALGPQDWRNRNGGANLVDGTYDMNWAQGNSTSLYSKLKDLFQRADKYGLKMIPCFNMAGRHSIHWNVTNSNIKNNDFWQGSNHFLVPVLIPDPDGMDKSFSSYLEVVQTAFQDAHVSYSKIDFVHIGHDEMATFTPDLICGMQNNDEQNTIISYGNDVNACYRIMAEEVVRRVDSTMKYIDPNTQVIMWADFWDPESNGGNDGFQVWTSGGPKKVKTMNVVLRSELNSVKDKLILMPWQYGPLYDGNDYDAITTLNHFVGNDFKVIVGVAMASEDITLVPGIQIMKEYVDASRSNNFKNSVIGCCVHWWENNTFIGDWNTSPRPPAFQMLPALAKEAKFFPNIEPIMSLLLD